MVNIICYNLATGAERIYVNDLPPEQNVRNAYMQDRGDWNWWGYKEMSVVVGKWGTVACGDWCTRGAAK
ncbi:MAG: hypothetical protein HY376_02850 [Candidatus Blackburnbacteria bacterium]|nr:hypothetical protein [Candidatus Blackburnbacteria bacterium]